jgi:hypothetical protein
VPIGSTQSCVGMVGAGMLAERAAGEVAFIGKTIERGGSRVVESG